MVIHSVAQHLHAFTSTQAIRESFGACTSFLLVGVVVELHNPSPHALMFFVS